MWIYYFPKISSWSTIKGNLKLFNAKIESSNTCYKPYNFWILSQNYEVWSTPQIMSLDPLPKILSLDSLPKIMSWSTPKNFKSLSTSQNYESWSTPQIMSWSIPQNYEVLIHSSKSWVINVLQGVEWGQVETAWRDIFSESG